jgi:hypothetical protein
MIVSTYVEQKYYQLLGLGPSAFSLRKLLDEIDNFEETNKHTNKQTKKITLRRQTKNVRRPSAVLGSLSSWLQEGFFSVHLFFQAHLTFLKQSQFVLNPSFNRFNICFVLWHIVVIVVLIIILWFGSGFFFVCTATCT